jgi:hypothetical protein
MDGYGLLLKINNINRMLYFSTFEEDGIPIMEAETDIVELWMQVKKMVKKFLKHHIELAKNKTLD